MKLNHFIGKDQLADMRENCKGDEGDHFKAMIDKLERTISTMPYGPMGQGDQRVATLHYFSGQSHWYILERDQREEQSQAFGVSCLDGDEHNAELGYISIEELISAGVELDLYYTPETLGTIKARFERLDNLFSR